MPIFFFLWRFAWWFFEAFSSVFDSLLLFLRFPHWNSIIFVLYICLEDFDGTSLTILFLAYFTILTQPSQGLIYSQSKGIFFPDALMCFLYNHLYLSQVSICNLLLYIACIIGIYLIFSDNFQSNFNQMSSYFWNWSFEASHIRLLINFAFVCYIANIFHWLSFLLRIATTLWLIVLISDALLYSWRSGSTQAFFPDSPTIISLEILDFLFLHMNFITVILSGYTKLTFGTLIGIELNKWVYFSTFIFLVFLNALWLHNEYFSFFGLFSCKEYFLIVFICLVLS